MNKITGIKSVERYDEPMTGDMLVVKFENGLTLVVHALNLSDDECQANLYTRWDPEAESTCVASLEFGVEEPHAVVYDDEWRAARKSGGRR
jgi:hypothetical protein